MPMLKRAILAVLLLCLPRAAGAANSDNQTHWTRDPQSGCALFDASLRPGDTVQWSGACQDGRAQGPGTASFTNGGTEFENFTGSFTAGMADDGAVTVKWGDGWSYDGEMAHGAFDGEGILVNDKRDHFEGLWSGGKLNGMGSVVHPDGERYDGVWKNDQPDGHGILTRADGSRLEGEFRNGKYASPDTTPIAATPVSLDRRQATAPIASHSALADLSGKTLLAVDGAALNLTPIEGGIERDIDTPTGTLEKTTFTFINDRLGTVAADAGAGAANVTGFFRLTDNGVEVRYADGRSEILSANADGGVLLRLETPGASASCRSFYPGGHTFSETEKKAAVAEYASRLGLPDASQPPSCPGAVAQTIPPAAAPEAAPHAHADLKHPAKFAMPKFTNPKNQLGTLQPVSVKDSVVHVIDAMPALPALAAAPMLQASTAPLPAAGAPDASTCLKVESDGSHWGFRNACAFDVQFAYCLAKGGDGLTGCTAGGVAGSVAAGSFGALLADKSFSESDAEHDFRWLACPGGAGEVAAHLEQTDPPAGRCLHAADIASNEGDRK